MLIRNSHKEVFNLMKMTRTILRRLEMKIQHAITLEQAHKSAALEPVSKPATPKVAEMKPN